MKKIRVGIIGQGRSGRNIHTDALERPKLRKMFEVVAVCDLQEERCKESCENNANCKAYTNYKEMFADKSIDLIVNASQSPDHVRISIEAAEAGFDVLCEKPLGRYASDIDKLTDAMKRTGKLIAPFQQSRFAATYVKVKEVMDSGVLGRIVMVKIAFNGFARRWDWQTLQSMNAGALLNTGPHPLDQALQFMGNVSPDKITCIMDGVNVYGDAEDHVKLIMSKANHPTIDLEISACTNYVPYNYMVYGSCGSLTAVHGKAEWKFFKPEEAPDQKLIREPLEGRAYCSEKLTFYNNSWEASEDSMVFNSPTEKLYCNLYDKLVNGKDLVVDLEQVRRQIAVAEECHNQNPLPKMD